jgi:hypothetical protein
MITGSGLIAGLWIRIHLNPDPDPDPQPWLMVNTDATKCHFIQRPYFLDFLLVLITKQYFFYYSIALFIPLVG